jgi:hypothetical protein
VRPGGCYCTRPGECQQDATPRRIN